MVGNTMSLSLRQLEVEKTIQALNFFINQDSSKIVSKMKLLKLLWLADRYTMRNFGYSLSRDTYYAMEHGPVASTTKDILDKKIDNDYANSYINVLSKTDIKTKRPVDFDEFSETDLTALRIVNSVYGKMSAYQLRTYTHKFPEWKRFEEKIDSIGGSYKMSLEDFFKNPDTRLGKDIFTENEEVLRINEEVLLQDTDLRAVFK